MISYERGQFKAGVGLATYKQDSGEPLQTAFQQAVKVSKALDGVPVHLMTNEGIKFEISSEDELTDALAALREQNRQKVLHREGDHYSAIPPGSRVNLFDAAASLATVTREAVKVKFWGTTVTVEPDTDVDTVEKNFSAKVSAAAQPS
ncbi:MAG TPA: hypothetical protein VL625_01360 [Patescibacteria group bacterium]|nr:hypothetical protein [Patescibacteria group bacterium]